MNKLIFLSIVLFSNIIFAQENKLSLSPEIGYIINFPEMNNSRNPKNTLGLHLGININVPINKNLSIGTAILYNAHRTLLDHTLSNFQIRILSNYNVNYIRVPINLSYHYKLAKGSLVFNAGPYLGLGVRGFWDSVSRDIINTQDFYNQKKKIDWGNGQQQTAPLDFGLNAGVSYAFRKGLYFKAQYSKSFNSYSVFNIRNIQNQFVIIAVGYNIKFGKKQASNINGIVDKP
jgi:hypothetical protein